MEEESDDDHDRIDTTKNDVVIQFPDSIKDLENDDEYEDECGYWIIVMLRGKTTGRMLKRDIFKAGVAQLFFGIMLIIIANYEYLNFVTTSYFDTNMYGAKLMDLMWLVSVPSFLAGCFSMLIIKFWGTLVTNRTILIVLMKVYMVILFLLLVTTVWLIAALILTFRKITFMVRFIFEYLNMLYFFFFL